MTQDSSVKIDMNIAGSKEGLITKAMLHNAKMNVRSNRKLLMVLFFLHLAALPLILIMLIYNILAHGMNDVEAYAIIGGFSTCAAAAAGILCALSAMPYLYKKSVVDMHYSLPMTTLQRFLSDFFSGLFVYIAPFLASELISAVLMLTGHLLCDGRTFIRDEPGTIESWNCTIFQDCAELTFKGIVGAVALMLMFYTLTVLVASCCGSLFEAVCYTVFANGFIPGMTAAVIWSSVGYVRGLEEEVYLARFIPYTSPIGGAIGLVLSLENSFYLSVDSGYVTAPASLTFGKWLVIFLIVTAVFGVVSYLIYRKRKAEDTGTPVVFGAFYHIIMTMCMVTIIFLFLSDNSADMDMLFPMIIVTAMIYFVFTVIRNRGFARFGRGVAAYAATVILSFGAWYVIGATEAFGAGKWLPAPESVSKAYISYNGYYNAARKYNDFGGFGTYSDTYVPVISDSENIKALTEAHSLLINDNANGMSNLRIMYKMKTGNYIVREYTLTAAAKDIISRIDMTNEFREQIANYTDRELGLYHSQGGFSLRPQWSISSYQFNNVQETGFDRLPADFIPTLCRAYRNDIMSISAEDYYHNKGKMWIIESRYGEEISINEHFKETVAYLSSCGFDMGETALNEKETMKLIDEFTVSVTPPAELNISMPTNRNLFSNMCVYREEYIDIVNKANKMYKSEKGCYTITVNGNDAVVPAEYTALAEKAYIYAVADEFIRRGMNNANNGDFSIETTDSDAEIIAGRICSEYFNYREGAQNVRLYKEFLKNFTSVYGKAKISESGYENIYDRMISYANNTESDNESVNYSIMTEDYAIAAEEYVVY